MSDDPDVFNYTYDPDCPPGTVYGLHSHQIVQHPTAMIDEILKQTHLPALTELLHQPTLVQKLYTQEYPPIEAVDFYDLCVAAARNHAVVLLSDDEYSKEWMKSYSENEVMSIWQPLADAGYENFMVDDDEIVVRMR